MIRKHGHRLCGGRPVDGALKRHCDRGGGVEEQYLVDNAVGLVPACGLLVWVEDGCRPEPAEHQHVQEVHRVTGIDVARGEKQGQHAAHTTSVVVNARGIAATNGQSTFSRDTEHDDECDALETEMSQRPTTLANGSTALGNFTLATSARSM